MNNQTALNQFQEYLKRKKKSKSTLIAYIADIKQLISISGNREVVTLSLDDYNEIYREIKKSYSAIKTVARKINTYRTFVKFLAERKIIEEDFSGKIVHPKYIQSKPRTLSLLEINKIREVCKENDKIYTMLELLIQTGIRISELANLQVLDITFDRKNPNIHINQQDSIPARDIPMCDKIYGILKAYIVENNPEKYVFCTKKNRRMEIRNIRASLSRYFQRAKVSNASVNDFRNAFIVFQLSNGVPISELSHIVGHKSPGTTERYLELLSKKYKEKEFRGLKEI